jgi:hypothetical protein
MISRVLFFIQLFLFFVDATIENYHVNTFLLDKTTFQSNVTLNLISVTKNYESLDIISLNLNEQNNHCEINLRFNSQIHNLSNSNKCSSLDLSSNLNNIDFKCIYNNVNDSMNLLFNIKTTTEELLRKCFMPIVIADDKLNLNLSVSIIEKKNYTLFNGNMNLSLHYDTAPANANILGTNYIYCGPIFQNTLPFETISLIDKYGNYKQYKYAFISYLTFINRDTLQRIYVGTIFLFENNINSITTMNDATHTYDLIIGISYNQTEDLKLDFLVIKTLYGNIEMYKVLSSNNTCTRAPKIIFNNGIYRLSDSNYDTCKYLNVDIIKNNDTQVYINNDIKRKHYLLTMNNLNYNIIDSIYENLNGTEAETFHILKNIVLSKNNIGYLQLNMYIYTNKNLISNLNKTILLYKTKDNITAPLIYTIVDSNTYQLSLILPNIKAIDTDDLLKFLIDLYHIIIFENVESKTIMHNIQFYINNINLSNLISNLYYENMDEYYEENEKDNFVDYMNDSVKFILFSIFAIISILIIYICWLCYKRYRNEHVVNVDTSCVNDQSFVHL